MASTNRTGRVSAIDYEAGTYEVTYFDRGKSVTRQINAMSNGEYKMPCVGQVVSVAHNSNGTAAGTTTGTVWNKTNKPAEGYKGLYRKEYGTSRKGQAYSRYDENTGVYTQYVDKRTGRTCNGEIFDEAKGPVSVIAGGQLQLKSSGASASIQAKTGMGIVAGTTVAIEAGTFMSLEATGAMSISAGGDFKFNIGGDSEEKRKGTTKQEYLDDVKQEVTGDVKQTLTGNLEQTVTGDVLQTITGTVTRNVTGDVTLSINGASITIRRLMGTVGAVKLQADAIYPGTMLEEWFEYGGQPGTFRLYINVTDTTEEHPAIIYSPAEMERRLITAKRWSAHLESLSYMVRHTLATGCRVDKWAYTVPECGTIYCGVWWMPATLGYTAHHALLTGGQPGAFAVSPEFTGTLPVPATVGYSVCGALRSGGVATGYTASPEFAGTLPEEAQHGN